MRNRLIVNTAAISRKNTTVNRKRPELLTLVHAVLEKGTNRNRKAIANIAENEMVPANCDFPRKYAGNFLIVNAN